MTRPLQLGLAGYLIAFVVVGWILLIPPIAAALQSGNQFRAWVLVSSWLIWTGLVAMLAWGSVRRWRWAFWAYLVLFAFLVFASVRGPNQTAVALASDLITGLLAAALLCASLVGLVRFGPWAMKRMPPSTTALPED